MIFSLRMGITLTRAARSCLLTWRDWEMDAEKGLVQSLPQTSRLIPGRSHGYWVGPELEYAWWFEL